MKKINMKTVIINFDSIEFECLILLNQIDNIEQGFEIRYAMITGYSANFQHILDQEQLIKLIYEQLK